MASLFTLRLLRRAPRPPEKHLWRARRPMSSAHSTSARKMAENAPLGGFGNHEATLHVQQGCRLSHNKS
eukprot:8771152-Alexandrium_andersonii.AAC.1